MKAPRFSLLFLPILLGSPVAADEFVNGQAADIVLGQEDFVSNSNLYLSGRINNPIGVTRDPVTGKVFVAARSDDRILRYSSFAAARTGDDPEAVFGQPNFTSTGANTTQAGLNDPYGLHLDARGRLWVADQDNDRVLCYVEAATRATGADADFVFGQADFTTLGAATGATGMDRPGGVWVDGDDNLWVADTYNNRVLRFDDISGKASGAAADAVLGQPDFATVTAGTTDSKMQSPFGLCVDDSGILWVADTFNFRVLRFDNAAAKSTGDPAEGVLGQPDFVSSVAALTQTGMSSPITTFVAPGGTLWVADFGNRRVLGFPGAAGLPDGAPASNVLGQPDFTTSGSTVDARTTGGSPTGIAPGPGGSLYVSDDLNDRVLRFSPIPTPATNTALVALKAQLLAKAKKLKKKAKAAKKKGQAGKAKTLKAKAKKLIKRANSL